MTYTKPNHYLIHCWFIVNWKCGNKLQCNLNRSTLGRVTSIDWPRSVYKSDVEHHFGEFWVEMAKWPSRSRSLTPSFNTGRENPKKHIGANLVILAHIHYKWSGMQTNFPWNLSQNDLDSQGQRPPFSLPAESFPGCIFGAYLVIPVRISISKQMSLPPFVFLEAIRHIRHFLIDNVFKTTLCIP